MRQTLRAATLFTLCLSLKASQLTTSADAFVAGTVCTDAMTCTGFRDGNSLNGTSNATVDINGVYGSAAGIGRATYGSVAHPRLV